MKGFGMNDKLIKIFSDLASFEDFNKRVFPAKAYRNAVKIFKELDFEIDDPEQVKGIPGIGDGIFNKIKDYFKTGTFKRYEEYKNSPAAKLKEIAEIKGFGMNKAKQLLENGISTLDELKKACENLKIGDSINGIFNFTKAMKIGLEFEAHTDKTRMSVSQHDAIADPILKTIKSMKEVIDAAAVGSRRRYDGSENYTIGDIDIIISSNADTDEFRKSISSLLDEVIMEGETKISGIKNHRQIDFRIVKPENYGSLLLHATGPMDFNIACRKIAIRNGWTLNEYGLFKKDTGQCLASSTEESIFETLGISFIQPKDRKNFSFKN